MPCLYLEEILKLIQDLNSNKAHEHNRIPIRMLQFCGPLIIKPFSLLFSNCLRNGVFPEDSKKKIFFSLHKKN